MKDLPTIFIICGSTRINSTNSLLINAIVKLYSLQVSFVVYKNIADLPHYNVDADNEFAPEVVTDFRNNISTADAVIICTPEYAHGVPGTLKNAIDWTVSSNNFFEKPVLLITAATEGKYGHNALLETLKVLQTKAIEDLQMVVPFIQTKISKDAMITDATLESALAFTFGKLLNVIETK
jgi:chromate reductase, NAD(P)H dehydrogenase (quinone)